MTAGSKQVNAAVVLTFAVALVGCQPPQQTPPVEPSPTVATPSETQQERLMRLDREAAEKAYSLLSEEGTKLAMAGGVQQPTKVIMENAVGPYLDGFMSDLRTLKKNGWRIDRPGRYSVTANRGWSPSQLGLTACEDFSRVRLLNAAGKEVNKTRPRRFVQIITATKSGGRWKITDVESEVVGDFGSRAGCAL